MKIDVILLPRDMKPETTRDRQVVVFDVLRASSTITTAMANGATQIHFFSSADEALAARGHYPDALLCGEKGCLKVPGFDLGNSPLEFTPQRVSGRMILMATTNGTKAIHAARGCSRLFAGSLLNARATAEALLEDPRDVVLLCAGTDGEPSLEDILGAGAVIHELQIPVTASIATTDLAMAAELVFRQAAANLNANLQNAQGARNLIAAGLADDIRHCSRFNALPTAVRIDSHRLCTTIV